MSLAENVARAEDQRDDERIATKYRNTTVLELEPTDAARSVPAVQNGGTVALAENSPAAIMMAAMSKGVSLADMRAMLDLQREWEAGEARKAFHEALARFKAEFLEITKRKRVTFETRDGGETSYSHAELSDVVEIVGPALARCGFSYRWDVQQAPGNVTVTCILAHSKGHSETVTMSGPPDASGKKNSIQQIASTVTYLQRYTLKAITGVAEKGQDDDGAAAGASDSEPVLDQWRAIAMHGEAALKKHYEKNVPTEDFWRQNGPALRACAKKADADAKGGAQ
jgi:ERF superfamily